MKKVLIRVLALVVVAGAAWGGYRFIKQFEQKQQPVPTATVRKGDVIIRSFTRGELRAVRSAMLIAPNLFGTVQITRLAPLGSFAREKDLVVEFDDSEVRSRLEEKELELEQLDEQLKKATAELEIRNNQDQVELLRARYSVRRAELEVKRNELLSEIDRKKNLLNLEEARRRLKQLESDIKSRLEQSQAELAVLRERKNKSMLEYQRERQRLSQVKLLAPMAGLVAVRQNRGGGGIFYRGMQLPDLREGDQIFPGMPVADVLDLSELEVAAKVGELDRANLHDGQDVTMRLDAVPDKLFHGKIKNLSGTASANIWSGDPAKKFDVVFSVDMRELLAGLGASPEQIRKVIETAERNRNKPVAASMSMAAMGGPPGMMSGPGGAPGAGGSPVMMAQGGAPGAEGREGGEGRTRMRMGGGQMSSEDQQKIRAAVQKFLNGRNPQDLSAEERQKMAEQIGALMRPRSGASAGQPGAAGGAQRPGAEGGQRAGRGTAGERGERTDAAPRTLSFSAGPVGPAASGGMVGVPRGFGMGGSSQFSEKDLENAKLPPPPEADSQLDVLLRPGLLADVQIIVEKVPNALHVPVQAVFEKEGKPIVYVKTGERYEERLIKPLKRSESIMVIAEGLKPGEQVALADPYAKKDKKGRQAGSGGKKGSVPAPAGSSGGGR